MGKQSSVRITFCAKQVNQCPHLGDVAEKNTFITEHFPVVASGFCVYSFLELKRVDVSLKKTKVNFDKEALNENFHIFVLFR